MRSCSSVFYRDKHSKLPIEDGIDVISMRGLALKRCLELAKLLDKRCAAIRDNDEQDPSELRAELGAYLDGTRRQLFIGDPAKGRTLEPQMVSANPEDALRRVLGLSARATVSTWMKNNKTEAAIRIADADEQLVAPSYLEEAIEFIRP